MLSLLGPNSIRIDLYRFMFQNHYAHFGGLKTLQYITFLLLELSLDFHLYNSEKCNLQTVMSRLKGLQ